MLPMSVLKSHDKSFWDKPNFEIIVGSGLDNDTLSLMRCMAFLSLCENSVRI